MKNNIKESIILYIALFIITVGTITISIYLENNKNIQIIDLKNLNDSLYWKNLEYQDSLRQLLIDENK